MIIATTWCEGYPLGLELEENEELPTGYPWIATGNYAVCRDIRALEDFIKTHEKELNEVSDSYWEYARKNWLHP